MKNYFIAFAAATLACLSSPQIYAQAPAAQLSIYFDAAADSLDARARFSLDSFARIAKEKPDAELQIAAYTDDRGSAEKNKALSTRRANAVVAHLSQHSIATNTQNVAAKGELALNEKTDLDTDAQRQKNRRVEIRLTTFAPQNLTEFYDYEARKNTQIFNISNKKADYIYGQKGGKLVIPPNAFVCKTDKSAPALPIKLELREAYTFGDMILQNLTTSSGENILQTGGMMYIAATDANGKALELKSGKEITITMPMPQTPLDSMQIFLSDRAGDHNGEPTDWVATNTPFVNNFSNNTQNANAGIATSFYYNSLSEVSAYKNVTVKSKQSVVFPKNIVAEPQKIDLVEPKLQKTFIALKDFQNQNPRQAKEAKKAYKARINTDYAAYNAEYKAARTQYDADMAAYQKEKQIFQSALSRYKKYQDSLEVAFFKLYKEHYTLFGGAASQHEEMNSRMYSCVNILARVTQLANNKLNTGNDLSRSEFKDIRQVIDDYTQAIDSLNASELKTQLQTLDSIYRNSVAYQMTRQPLLYFYNQKQPKIMVNPPTQMSAGVTFALAYKEFVEKNNADFPKNTHLSFDDYCKQYYNSLGYKIETLAYIQEGQDFEKYMKLIQFQKIAAKFLALQKLERNATAAYEQRKADLGELTDAKLLAHTAGSLAKINKLGWINCDRFYNTPASMLSNVIVECAYSSSIQAYVVLPSKSSILPMTWHNKGYTINGRGVPENLLVKIVLIQVQDGKINLAIHEGKTKTMTSVVPNFEPCNAAELAKKLSSI
jgi:hypothetical protein